MSSKIKQKIAHNVFKAIHNKFYFGRYDDLFGCFKLTKNNGKILWQVDLPLKSQNDLDSKLLVQSQSDLLDSQIVKEISTCSKECCLELDLKHFMKDVLDSNPTQLNYKPSPRKVIVEFSSPNIAKPFHMGHLRSTIIGNSLANIKKKLGKDVVKMNYLGDWGTQFGMIQIGVQLNNYTEEDLQKDPIKTLFKAYVAGNREAEVNDEVYNRAKKIFSDLESGDEEILRLWSKYKEWTVAELNRVYKKLGVVFDEYEWESDYSRKNADEVLGLLQEKGLLSEDDKGRKVVTVGDSKIPLVKSDNTTLYLLRDLMAVSRRRSKHKFDELYYVVENGQNVHFHSLFSICKQLNFDEGVHLEHVKFGRIHGMSTRKGKVTFLSDILEEAQERCYNKQLSTRTTKTNLDNQEESIILGLSAVIINDLKQHRKKDYEFSWENSLQLKGETGVRLQYCHCRLCSLEENCGVVAASDCDPDALLEPEAIDLVLEIARFEEVLCRSNSVLEPCIFTAYLFKLVKAINSAIKVLPVKNAEPHVASQRLLLFTKSRVVLHDGMQLLGLKPLNKM